MLSRFVNKDQEIEPGKAVEAINALMRIGLIRMNRIQEPFIRSKNKSGRTPKRRILECGEKTGKTRINIMEGLAHAMGFRPWLDNDDPDFKIAIRVPNQGLMGCMTMAQSVTAKIEPELLALIPPHCAPEWKRDTTGALKSVTLRYDYLGKVCGSTIHIRSYNQLADTFLGIDYDWLSWDEPPPEDVLRAAERGKVVTNAPSWFAMTPLSQAYLYDLFSVHAFNAGGTDPEIAIYHGPIWSNCQDWCRNCNCVIPENNPVNMADPHMERPTDRCPMCNEVMGFMPRAGIEEYLKMYTDPDERAAHEDGKWAHLSGLVYKELDRAVHLYKDFEIPRHWMRIEAVDPSDARPTRWLFGAVSPEEVVINGKQANRIYWYTYLLPSGNIGAIAKAVKVKRAEHNYEEPQMVILDAKFGVRVTQSLDDSTSWEEQLDRAGIKHIVLSHSAPGDVALGHKVVKEYLQSHYSALKDKSFPAMMFAEEGCKGNRSPIQDAFNYQWKPGTDKPEEAYKDFCDCFRYAALEQPVYRPPGQEDNPVLKFLASRENQDYAPLMFGLRTAR